MSQVDSRESLDDMHPVAVHVTDVVEPRLIVEADGIHDERAALPSSDRVTQPRRLQVFARWMLPAIHEYLAVPVHRLREKKDVRWCLDDAERVGLGSWRGDRKALQLRIVLRLHHAHSRERRRKIRERFAPGQQIGNVVDAGTAQPYTIEVGLAVWLAWRRSDGRLRRDAAARALLRRRRLRHADLRGKRRGERNHDHESETRRLSHAGLRQRVISGFDAKIGLPFASATVLAMAIRAFFLARYPVTVI